MPCFPSFQVQTQLRMLILMEEFFVLMDCLNSFNAARYCLNIPFFALSTFLIFNFLTFFQMPTKKPAMKMYSP